MTGGMRRTAVGAGLLGGLLLHAGVLISVRSDKRAIQERARAIVAPGTAEGQVVTRLAAWVRDELHHSDRAEVERLPPLVRLNYLRNPFGIGPRTALDYGGHHEGACESSSRVLMEMLRAHGIPSRPIILADADLESLHTLLEVRYDGSWGAVDPLYNVVYRRADGRPASLRELRDDQALFLANASSGFEYGYGPDRQSRPHPFNIRKYSFKTAHYFSYDKLGPLTLALHALLERIAGEDATLRLVRPNFYTYPGLTTLVVLDVMALGLGAVVIGVGWWRRRRARAQAPAAELLGTGASASARTAR